MPSSLLALVAVLMMTGALAASAQSPLATTDQRALDKQSLRVLACPAVKAQESLVAQAFAADPYA